MPSLGVVFRGESENDGPEAQIGFLCRVSTNEGKGTGAAQVMPGFDEREEGDGGGASRLLKRGRATPTLFTPRIYFNLCFPAGCFEVDNLEVD